MKSIFEKDAYEEILNRIEQLKPNAERQWGKMNVEQMLAHCNETMFVVTDQKITKQRLIGKLIGRFFRKDYLGEAPLRKNSPTNPLFVITDERVFAKEKELLLKLVKQFSEGGEEKCTKQPHSFFGPFTPKEWGISTYKHLNHHLQQFGA
jgi:hypothetical protein